MSLDQLVRDIVREELSHIAADAPSPDPVMITPEEAMTLMGGINKTTFWAIAHDAANNGFPIAKLSERTYLVDKTRLVKWLAKGGLGVRHGS